MAHLWHKFKTERFRGPLRPFPSIHRAHAFEKSLKNPMSSPALPVRRLHESATTTKKKTNENKDHLNMRNITPGQRRLPERQ